MLYFLFLRFHHSTLPERGAGGGVLGGSLSSAAALLVWMRMGREGERAHLLFYFELPTSPTIGGGEGDVTYLPRFRRGRHENSPYRRHI